METIENSVIWEMSKKDAFDLFRIPEWNTFVRKLIQEVQFNTEVLLEESQNLTAEDRYQKLLNENGQLVNRISQKHLASFLGIAPQSLSRIRKEFSQK